MQFSNDRLLQSKTLVIAAVSGIPAEYLYFIQDN